MYLTQELAGALAAAKLHIPVAHVEAGMRSYNREMPEEHNRIVSDHLSDLLFCPTKSSVKILKGEGITKGVYFTGDVMWDIFKKLTANRLPSTVLKKLSIEPKKYILTTVHRQENTDKKENLGNILKAFEGISETIIYPIHPRTEKCLKIYHFDSWIRKIPNLKLIEPVGFFEMMLLEQQAKMILTDSGGVQKEAYLHRVPCLALRKETEWPETIKAGWNKLVGTNIQTIIKFTCNFPKPKNHPNFLGDGTAYKKIAKIIKNFLSQSTDAR